MHGRISVYSLQSIRKFYNLFVRVPGTQNRVPRFNLGNDAVRVVIIHYSRIRISEMSQSPDRVFRFGTGFFISIIDIKIIVLSQLLNESRHLILIYWLNIFALGNLVISVQS